MRMLSFSLKGGTKDEVKGNFRFLLSPSLSDCSLWRVAAVWRGLWRETAAQVKDLLFIRVEKNEIRLVTLACFWRHSCRIHACHLLIQLLPCES